MYGIYQTALPNQLGKITQTLIRNMSIIIDDINMPIGKVHPCTGTEALYRPYGA